MQSNTRPWLVTLGMTGALILLFGFQNCAPMLPMEGVATLNSNARATATPGPVQTPSPGTGGYTQNVIDGVCSDNTTTDPMASRYVGAANGTLLGFVNQTTGSENQAAFWKISSGNVIHGVVCKITGPDTKDNSWRLAAIADFNGDFNPDVLWRNATSGEVAIWLMNGANRTQTKILTTSGATTPITMDYNDWELEGVGIFDGTGRASVVWRNRAGSIQIWAMNGLNSPVSRSLGAGFENAPTGYSIVGFGDFRGDYRSDIVFRNGGSHVVWFVAPNGAVTSETFVDPIDAGVQKIVIGDYNGDARSDLLLQNADGTLTVRYMSYRAQVSTALTVAKPADGWQLLFSQDVTTDNISDWIWKIPGAGDPFVAYSPLSGAPQPTRTLNSIKTGWEPFQYLHH